MTIEPSQAKAGRAMGAISFTLFGAAWLTLWYLQTHAGGPHGWLVIAVETALLLGFAVRKYWRNRLAPFDEADRAGKRQASRVFRWANVIQWVLIFAVSELLARAGHREWIVPVILTIVGLHLLPIAAALSYRPYYITGGLLITLAAVYPVLADTGPTDPVGLFGAGVILWGSAAWALAS